MAHFALLLLTSLTGISPLWEAGLAAPPRGGPLLVPDGSVMMTFLPLGDHGLAGWDSHGSPLPGFPVSDGGNVIHRPAAFRSPSENRTLVAYSTFDGAIHAVDFAGREAPGWPFMTGSTVVTGISAVDLDMDGVQELAFGTSDNRIHLLSASGTEFPGWPVTMESLLLWQPSEMPLGSGCDRGLICAMNSTMVFVLDHSGNPVPGWPVYPGYPVGSVPVSIDMNSDGTVDLVFATQNRQVQVYDIRGERIEGWPFQLDARPVNGAAAAGMMGRDRNTPCFAVSTIDSLVYLLNGDGSLAGSWKWPGFAWNIPSPPVIVETWSGQAVVVATGDGRILAWDWEGDPVDGFPFDTGMNLGFAPAAGDLNGDGVLELVVAGNSGLVVAYSIDTMGGSAGEWPQTLRDEGNSGCYTIPMRPVAAMGDIAGEFSGTVTIPYSVTGGETTGMTVAYSTDAGFEWTETTNYRDTGGSIEWFTDRDLSHADDTQCRIRITPRCEQGTGQGGMSPVFHVDNNSPPVIYAAPLVDAGDGWLTVPYAVADPEGDIIQLQAEYSTDGGASWKLAHLSGTTLEVEPWFYGDPVAWNAGADIEGIPEEEVSFRIRAADDDPGPWAVFGEGLAPDLSLSPSGQVIVPPGEASGRMNVGVRFPDRSTDPLGMRYEYSTDEGEIWLTATITGTGTGASVRDYAVVTWDSEADLPGFDGTLLLRVVPPDSVPGVAVPSAPMHLDNNSPPSVAVTYPTAYDVFSGLVPVRFTISDRESDEVSLGLEFRLSGSDSWTRARGLGFSGPYTEPTYTGIIHWNSTQDIPEAELLDIEMRLSAFDGDTSYSQVVTPVTLNNARLPSVTQASLVSLNESTGSATFSFELFDSRERVLDVMVDYSTDDGTSWNAATVSGTLSGLSTFAYRGTFRWDYRADLAGESGTMILRITPVTGSDYGKPLLLDLVPR